MDSYGIMIPYRSLVVFAHLFKAAAEEEKLIMLQAGVCGGT